MEAAWRGYFCVDHDETGLAAEANVLRYRPLDRVEVRHGGDVDRRVQLLRIVADVTGVELVESSSSGESDEHFARRLARGAASRVRLLTDLSANARQMLHAADVPIDLADPVAAPCIELPRWVREQAISRTLHRHGRL